MRIYLVMIYFQTNIVPGFLTILLLLVWVVHGSDSQDLLTVFILSSLPHLWNNCNSNDIYTSLIEGILILFHTFHKGPLSVISYPDIFILVNWIFVSLIIIIFLHTSFSRFILKFLSEILRGVSCHPCDSFIQLYLFLFYCLLFVYFWLYL